MHSETHQWPETRSVLHRTPITFPGDPFPTTIKYTWETLSQAEVKDEPDGPHEPSDESSKPLPNTSQKRLSLGVTLGLTTSALFFATESHLFRIAAIATILSCGLHVIDDFFLKKNEARKPAHPKSNCSEDEETPSGD